MKNLVDLDDGIFYSLGDGFVVLNRPTGPCTFVRGVEFTLNSMISMWELFVEGEKEPVGFFFYTAVTTVNKGGFLLAYREAKRGAAKECQLIIRNDMLMVYDYPGCGALAITTKVNPTMLSIIQGQ